jgi:DNA recombination protein RmuC
LRATVVDTLTQLGTQQRERLNDVGLTLSKFSETQERSQQALRQAVEQRLDAIRSESAAKLEEMRRTVDERLQTTLEARLGESFTRVVEQLERVHKGIGEMQSLAAGVGDLKKVLSNVRVRGAFGELQLGMLLDQFLSPEQIVRNAQIKENSQERVEFAIRLPGREPDGDVLLPVDSKFPHEDYERLLIAAENGDAEGVTEAGKALESRIRTCAKAIRDKYVAPPRTTDFGILFLPTESLYAEVIRRPGLFESVQREFHVTLTGPTTFTAVLNALQMGFRSLAIEKRSSEVWKILAGVRNEFDRYNEVVDRLAKQLNTAARSVENLGVRTRAMGRKLRDVEVLPDDIASLALGLEDTDESEAANVLESEVSQPESAHHV